MFDKEMKQKELNRLCRLLYEREKEFEKAKHKRIILTIVGFSIFYFVVQMMFSGHTDIVAMLKAVMSADLSELFAMVVVPIIFACVHFVINASVFGALFQKNIAESRRLEAIEEQIKELEERQ